MIISIDAHKKTLDKIQQPLMIRILRQEQMNFLNLIMGTYKKPTASFILKGEIWNTFLLRKTSIQARLSTLTWLFNTVLIPTTWMNLRTITLSERSQREKEYTVHDHIMQNINYSKMTKSISVFSWNLDAEQGMACKGT